MMSTHAHLATAAQPATGHHVTALAVLATFVALNTVMYVSLALIKTMPRIRISRRLRRPYVRAESRGVEPSPGSASS